MRRTGRWSVMLAVLAALAMTVVACGSDGETAAEAPAATGGEAKEVKKIAFFGFAAANSFAQATWVGVQDAAKQEGVEAKFFDPNFDGAKQVSQIQDAIASGAYEAFVIQANDGNAVVPAIEEAIDAGIAVVAEFVPVGTRYDTLEPQVEGMIFVGEPTTEIGEALADLAIEACEGVDPCNVAFLEGSKALPLDNARTDAFKARLETVANVKLVASVEGGYSQDTGLKAAQDVLQANDDVDVMVGSSQAILGAQQAVEDAGLAEQMKLIGNGGSRQAVSNVKTGKWFAAYVFAERSNGEKAAEIAIAAARGEDVPSSFDTRELRDPIGTKERLGDFEGQYDE
jgi:ribose transport system substrate-binding protein